MEETSSSDEDRRMLYVAEYRGFSRLSEGVSLWSDIAARRGLQTEGFVANYLRMLRNAESKAEPRVLAVSSQDHTLGLLPLMQVEVPMRKGTARLLTNAGEDGEPCLPPVGSSHAILWLAAMRHLQDVRESWDVLDLHAESEAAGRRLQNALRLTGLRYTALPATGHSTSQPATRCLHYAPWNRRARRLRRLFSPFQPLITNR